MSHAIDFDALDEKLFLLQQLVFASKPYCKRQAIGNESDVGEANKDEYWGWIKSLTSNYLIECAVKTRVFHDYLRNSHFENDFDRIDADACQGLTIATISKGAFAITLRETCNKIIHATRVVLVWNDTRNNQYWGGKLLLLGKKGAESWELELNIGDWALAMTRYHKALEESEGRVYAGQDW